jgi:hypothetical protein
MIFPCYKEFQQFMYVHKIGAASVAYSIGLASAEFAKALTMKAIIPFFQRVLHHFGAYAFLGEHAMYEFHDINVTVIYWLCMVILSYFISEHIFGRWVIGAKTVLAPEDRKTMKIAEQAVRQEPSTLQYAQTAVVAAFK